LRRRKRATSGVATITATTSIRSSRRPSPRIWLFVAPNGPSTAVTTAAPHAAASAVYGSCASTTASIGTRRQAVSAAAVIAAARVRWERSGEQRKDVVAAAGVAAYFPGGAQQPRGRGKGRGRAAVVAAQAPAPEPGGWKECRRKSRMLAKAAVGMTKRRRVVAAATAGAARGRRRRAAAAARAPNFGQFLKARRLLRLRVLRHLRRPVAAVVVVLWCGCLRLLRRLTRGFDGGWSLRLRRLLLLRCGGGSPSCDGLGARVRSGHLIAGGRQSPRARRHAAGAARPPSAGDAVRGVGSRRRGPATFVAAVDCRGLLQRPVGTVVGLNLLLGKRILEKC